MKYEIENIRLKEIFEVMDDLDKLLTERISDLHQVKGGMQSRHAYCYYRKMVWDAKNLMAENLKEIKNKKK